MKEEKIVKATLIQYEKWAYFIICISSLIYSIFQLYLASVDNKDVISIFHFMPGWSWNISNKRDSSYEIWEFWISSFKTIGPFLLTHVVMSVCCSYVNSNIKRYILVLYSLTALYCIFGAKYLAVLIIHCLLVYIISSMGSYMKSWTMFIILLISITESICAAFIKVFCLDENSPSRMHTLFLIAISMLMLKYISFSTEWIESRQIVPHAIKFANPPKSNLIDKKLKFTFIDMLSYCFYLPTFFYGPIINYDDFYIHFHKSVIIPSKDELKSIAKQIVGLALSAIVCLISFHFVYFSAISKELAILQRISLWALAGNIFCMALFFHFSYLIMYGIISQILKFDNIPTAFDISPISVVNVLSSKWKTYDTGLNLWLKQNIFAPLGGDQNGLIWRFVSFTACGVFVGYWHNDRLHIQVWACIMVLDFTVEWLASAMYNIPTMKAWRKANFHQIDERRIEALLYVPIIIGYILLVCYFTNGLRLCVMVLVRLFMEGAPFSILIVITNVYCFIQVLQEVEMFLKDKVKQV